MTKEVVTNTIEHDAGLQQLRNVVWHQPWWHVLPSIRLSLPEICEREQEKEIERLVARHSI
jgi:hypothetical protein